MAESCGTNGCANEQRLTQLEKNDEALTATLNKMDEKLDAMLSKLNRIEVLENSHHYQTEAVSRAHKRIDELETRQKVCEAFKNKAEGMATVAWAIWTMLGASVFMLFIKILFFMGHQGMTP
jgi:hypothetical protein